VHSIYASLGPPKSTTQTASRSVHFSHFAGLTTVTDRQTDRPVSGFDSRGRHFISVGNQPPRSTQPSTLCGDGKMSTSQRAVMLCVMGIKAGMACLKPNSITLAGSKLVRSRFEAGSKLVTDSVMEFGFEPVCDQLRTSFEPASVMESGFYR